MSAYDPYNPLDKNSIAESLVRTMLSQPCGPLPPSGAFYGAGVYAIYYRGTFPAYEALTRANQTACEMPIYVGKAVPKGGRMGVNVDAAATSQALYDRLREHAESIRAASNLRLEDFSCRYRVIEELFIELAERALIQQYKPLWNGYLAGFGNHDPGRGRHGGKRSGWDEVHPGRAWAANLQDSARTADEWTRGAVDYLTKATSAVGELPMPEDDEGEAE